MSAGPEIFSRSHIDSYTASTPSGSGAATLLSKAAPNPSRKWVRICNNDLTVALWIREQNADDAAPSAALDNTTTTAIIPAQSDRLFPDLPTIVYYGTMASGSASHAMVTEGW